eukprot:TRINITY_DN15196_c0_g1_i1.p1 TRINITY_DN15196_c0_g1~~TRINITY_DN15196_c0_g1_i1.p1  ORF type:complete len:115 (-),score=23.57 TRINITY_DN15196_c0_g1_i1:262-555(-)
MPKFDKGTSKRDEPVITGTSAPTHAPKVAETTKPVSPKHNASATKNDGGFFNWLKGLFGLTEKVESKTVSKESKSASDGSASPAKRHGQRRNNRNEP